jgi:molecular chaperone GrpE
MNRKNRDERGKIFEKVLESSALAATTAVEYLTKFQYDKWFARLKSANYLSNFMSWFNKKMNEKENKNEDLLDEIIGEFDEEIPVSDKRRFNAEGELNDKGSAQGAAKAEVKSQEVTRLENALKEERTRREAAEAKLVGVQSKFEEVKTQMERETQEMRTRMQKTLEDRAKQGQFNFLTTLLPVLDNLNLAVSHAEKDSSLEHLLGGVKGTARSFEQALMNVGVEPVPAVGTDFNPELHEAIDMVETGAENDGKITGEYSRGYKFGDRLLRPAKVQVGRGK